jgi:hypothetical protein
MCVSKCNLRRYSSGDLAATRDDLRRERTDGNERRRDLEAGRCKLNSVDAGKPLVQPKPLPLHINPGFKTCLSH